MDRVGAVLVETYRIERLVGEGGMGSVYEASHVRLPKRFAVKFLNVPMLDNVEALRRFRREAEIVAALDHPSIVSLFDYNVTETGVPYIVLEFLDGEHLGKLLERAGKLDLGAAMRILVPVASALQYAHARQIVHRDLKPENIIITRGGQVKVVDFGIARMGGRQSLTAHNTVLGTAPYMAPEQMTGQELDGRADEFALAAIAYEMLSGKMAFGADSVQATAARIVFHNPPPVEGLSEPVNFALGKALAKKPPERFSTVEAFSQALVEAASAKPSEAPRTPAPAPRRMTLRPDWGLQDPSRELSRELLQEKAATAAKEAPAEAPLPGKKHPTSPTRLRSLGEEDAGSRVVDDLGDVGPDLPGEQTTITAAAVAQVGPDEPTPEPIPPTLPGSKTLPETPAPVLPAALAVAAPPIAKPLLAPVVPPRKPTPAAVSAVAKPSPVAAAPIAKPSPVAAAPIAKPSPVAAAPIAKPTPVAAAPIAKPSPAAMAEERSATLPNIAYRDRSKTVPDVHPAATLADLAALDAAQRERATTTPYLDRSNTTPDVDRSARPAEAPPSPGRKEWPTEKTPAPLIVPPDAATAAMALLRKTTEFVSDENDLPLKERKTMPLPDDVKQEAALPIGQRSTMPPDKVQLADLRASQWPTMPNEKVKVEEAPPVAAGGEELPAVNVVVDEEPAPAPSEKRRVAKTALAVQLSPGPMTSQIAPSVSRSRNVVDARDLDGPPNRLRLVLIIAIALASAGTALIFILQR